jgi:hypothetical protein
MEKKTVWGRMMVTIDGKVQGIGTDIGEIMTILDGYMADNGISPKDFEEKSVALYNVVGEVISNIQDHFRFTFNRNEPYIGDAYEGTTDEYEYKVEDTGRTFEDIDSLKDYLVELIRDGEYTAEDVSNFDIRQTMTNIINFEDAQEGELEIDFEWKKEGEDLLDLHHAREFMLVSDIDEMVEQGVNKWLVANQRIDRNHSTMSDEEIESEIMNLDAQLTLLMRERRNRNL